MRSVVKTEALSVQHHVAVGFTKYPIARLDEGYITFTIIHIAVFSTNTPWT